MRRTRVPLLLAIGILFGISGQQARAQGRGDGGAGFWEKMSGPGVWFYTRFSPSLCLEGERTPGSNRFCSVDGGLLWLNLGVSYAHTGTEEQENLQSPPLKQFAFEPSLDMKAFTLFDYAPVYFGIGASVHWFSGEDVGFWRGSMEARFGIIFARIGHYSLGFRYARKMFFEGFTAEDFGDPVGTFTTDGNDPLHTFFWYVTF